MHDPGKIITDLAVTLVLGGATRPMKILDPPDLRDLMAETVRDLAKMYGT
ncbi:hypothetical protein [Acrocarpospora sp. B8E8]